MHLSRFSIVPLCFGLLAVPLARLAPAQIIVPDDFATIQAAVDAAGPGGMIVIRDGDYQEQVLISNKTLTLRGEPGATLVAPVVMAQTLLPFTTRRPILTIRNAVVHLRGLSFDGRGSGLANLGLSGAYYLAASGTVRECSFTGFRRAQIVPVPELPSALHVMNPEDVAGPVQNVLIIGNSVRDSEFGILVKGDTEAIPATFDPNAVRLTATIRQNEVVGIAAWPWQNIGIFSQWGVRSTIVDNDVTGFAGVGTAFSIAILVGQTNLPIPFLHPPSVVAHNRVSGSILPILALNAKRAKIIGNRVVGSSIPGSGGIGVSGEDNVIAQNLVDMSAAPGDVGVFLFGLQSGGPTFFLGKAQGTKVIGNTIISASLPIWEQLGSSGTKLIGNTIQP